MSGDAGFQDDETISDDATVYRRISPKFVDWKSLDLDDTPKIPSQGFQDYPAEIAREKFGLPGACMSIDLAEILECEGKTPKDLLEEYPSYGLVSLNVGEMRRLGQPSRADWGQGVVRDPRPDAPWHAVSFVFAGKKKTDGMKNAIRDIATWVFLPTRESTP